MLDTFRPGGLIVWCHIFFAFLNSLWEFHGKYTGVVLPFPPPVDHILSELSAMTHLSWVALHSMTHSFIELHKPLRHDKAVIHEGDWNAKVGSQDIPGVTGKFGLREQNEAGQRLTEFCQENALTRYPKIGTLSY